MPSLRAIVQIDDLVVYESMSDAAKSYGKTPAMMMRAAEYGTRCGGKRWRFKVDDDPEFGGLIVCDQTDERFATVARAAKTFGVSAAEIYGSVLGTGEVDERYTFSIEDHRGGGCIRATMSSSTWQGPVHRAHVRAPSKKKEARCDGDAGEAGGEDDE